MSDETSWDRYLETCRTAPRGIVEVTFELSPDWHPLETESMWAQQVGPDLFVLRNSPFEADGVSLLDTVRAELRGAEWFFLEVHARSGHSTYRLRRADRSLREPWSRTFAPLKRLGCAMEGADERWAAVDVPPAADIHAVAVALLRGEKEGRWQFEEAHFGHPRA
jgi:hypothetical protein